MLNILKKLISLVFLVGNMQRLQIYNKLLTKNPVSTIFKVIVKSIYDDLLVLVEKSKSLTNNNAMNRVNLFVYTIVIWKILRFLWLQYQRIFDRSVDKQDKKRQSSIIRNELIREIGSVPPAKSTKYSGQNWTSSKA